MKKAVLTSFDKGNNEGMCWVRGKSQREQTAVLGRQEGLPRAGNLEVRPGAGQRFPADPAGGVGRGGRRAPRAERTAHACAVVGGVLELKERNQSWSSGGVRTGWLGGGEAGWTLGAALYRPVERAWTVWAQ